MEFEKQFIICTLIFLQNTILFDENCFVRKCTSNSISAISFVNYSQILKFPVLLWKPILFVQSYPITLGETNSSVKLSLFFVNIAKRENLSSVLLDAHI